MNTMAAQSRAKFKSKISAALTSDKMCRQKSSDLNVRAQMSHFDKFSPTVFLIWCVQNLWFQEQMATLLGGSKKGVKVHLIVCNVTMTNVTMTTFCEVRMLCRYFWELK